MLTDYVPTADDIESALLRIGIDLYEDTQDETLYPSLITNGHCMLVTFLDLEIWNSENGNREYIDEDVYEDLEQYLRRIIMKRIEILNKVNLLKQ